MRKKNIKSNQNKLITIEIKEKQNKKKCKLNKIFLTMMKMKLLNQLLKNYYK